MVRGRVRSADCSAGGSLAGDQGRTQRPDRGADRLRQDAGRLHGGDRRPGAPGDAGTLPDETQVVYVRRSRRSPTTSRRTSSSRSPAFGPRCASEACPTSRSERRPHRRHALAGARAYAAQAAAYPRHHAGIALHPARLRVRPQDAVPHPQLIVDEIHAIAGNKRGSHLACRWSVCRRLRRRLVRIGLSATVKPVETVAHFLVGVGHGKCQIIDTGHQRPRDLAIEIPGAPTRGGDVARHLGRDLQTPC